MRAVVKMLRCH